jgi:hypothetical protein
MAYLGNDLQVAYPTYKILDNISASFNGSTTSFALAVSGAAPVPAPINEQQLLISVGGVIQQPDPSGTNGFRLSGGNIVFSSAPSTGEAFFGVILAGSDYINVGASFPDGQVSAPSITFDNDLDTGFYRTGSGAISFASNGVAQPLAFTGIVQTFTSGQAAEITTLTDGATITPNLSDSNNFVVTLGGNRALANPTNILAGQSGSIFIVQDGTGSRTLTWGSYWDFPNGTAPTLSTGANAIDRVDYVVRSATSIHSVWTGNYS